MIETFFYRYYMFLLFCFKRLQNVINGVGTGNYSTVLIYYLDLVVFLTLMKQYSNTFVTKYTALYLWPFFLSLQRVSCIVVVAVLTFVTFTVSCIVSVAVAALTSIHIKPYCSCGRSYIHTFVTKSFMYCSCGRAEASGYHSTSDEFTFLSTSAHQTESLTLTAPSWATDLHCNVKYCLTAQQCIRVSQVRYTHIFKFHSETLWIW